MERAYCPYCNKWVTYRFTRTREIASNSVPFMWHHCNCAECGREIEVRAVVEMEDAFIFKPKETRVMKDIFYRITIEKNCVHMVRGYLKDGIFYDMDDKAYEGEQWGDRWFSASVERDYQHVIGCEAEDRLRHIEDDCFGLINQLPTTDCAKYWDLLFLARSAHEALFTLYENRAKFQEDDF